MTLVFCYIRNKNIGDDGNKYVTMSNVYITNK